VGCLGLRVLRLLEKNGEYFLAPLIEPNKKIKIKIKITS
jgi:hypothetical protein